MSAQANSDTTQKKPAEVIKDLVTGLDEMRAAQAALAEKVEKSLEGVKTKAHNPNYSVAGIIGGIPSDNKPYSILKAAAYSAKLIPAEEAKYEIDVNNKLREIYKSAGWRPTMIAGWSTFITPYCTEMIPHVNTDAERLVGELKVKMIGGGANVDPEEVRWLQKKISRNNMVRKDLGTVDDTAGGVLVGFPTLMELIDIQRNIEVFNQAGATEASLPPNGRAQYPKLTGSTTAYWIGEGATITESTPATGYLDLQAKKLGVLTDLNNELVRFGSIAAEAMLRTDMAKVAALKMDLAQLEGTGGSQIKGLITYPSAAAWTPGTDPLLAYTVTSNTIQISDAAEMEALLPDTAGAPTAWVMRRNLWSKLKNRRASSVSSADSAGQYLASVTRSVADNLPLEWDGVKVVRSSQVSNTRGSGAQTYVILGYFPDWITARFGVLEFLSSQVGDTQMTNDQTRIRCIQHVDAGPRHASSFVFADSITVQ